MPWVSRIARLIPFALVLGSTSARADVGGAQGVYQTAEDFTGGRLTSASTCKSPDHKIELHDILKKPHIHVTHGGETREYLKKELYGFRSCSGRDYRFVDDREYRILEARTITIYVLELVRRHGTVRSYYFSVNAEGTVFPLTRDNVKRAFPDNHTFHDSVDGSFRNERDLIGYDKFHKMFKLNRLLIAPSSR